MSGKIFVVLGKTCSGKTTLVDQLIEYYSGRLKKIVTYTTRLSRVGEKDGVDYHFITKQEFLWNNKFICKEKYEVLPTGYQYYGVNKDDLETDKDVVIILTPSGFDEIKQIYGDRVFGIYIMSPIENRLKRYVNRENGTSLEEANRRIEADEKAFFEFEFKADEIIINNENKSGIAFAKLNNFLWWKID